uniref:Uncharacterized protein n=1 Tax=Arundo donax TaxID=35708 RepID=A0A0A9FAE7_ARUDO
MYYCHLPSHLRWPAVWRSFRRSIKSDCRVPMKVQVVSGFSPPYRKL